MRLKTRTWFIISVLCFLGAAYFWRLGDERAARNGQPGTDPLTQTNSAASGAQPKATNAASLTNSPQTTAALSNQFPYLLSNSSKSLEQLMESDTALLLQNALFDTSEPMNVSVPPHLRSDGKTGSYVVQARGGITDSFRKELTNAGAKVVAYVPHNAYLVQMGVAGSE